MVLLMLCSFVAAMNVPGGGKNDIPNRLKRHFAVFYVPPPSDAAVNSMFGALIQVCKAYLCEIYQSLRGRHLRGVVPASRIGAAAGIQ